MYFVHSTILWIYSHTDNWCKLLSPRQVGVKECTDLHLYDEGNIFGHYLEFIFKKFIA